MKTLYKNEDQNFMIIEQSGDFYFVDLDMEEVKTLLREETDATELVIKFKEFYSNCWNETTEEMLTDLKCSDFYKSLIKPENKPYFDPKFKIGDEVYVFYGINDRTINKGKINKIEMDEYGYFQYQICINSRYPSYPQCDLYATYDDALNDYIRKFKERNPRI